MSKEGRDIAKALGLHKKAWDRDPPSEAPPASVEELAVNYASRARVSRVDEALADAFKSGYAAAQARAESEIHRLTTLERVAHLDVVELQDKLAKAEHEIERLNILVKIADELITNDRAKEDWENAKRTRAM